MEYVLISAMVLPILAMIRLQWLFSSIQSYRDDGTDKFRTLAKHYSSLKFKIWIWDLDKFYSSLSHDKDQ